MKIQIVYKWLLLILFVTGCSSSPNSPLLPENQSYQATDYLVGAGDSLNIFVWRNPDLSSNVTVRPDGKISSPLIDDLAVSGLPASIIAQKIEVVLKAYIREPKVSVIVSGFKGAVSQQIRVIGNATNPMSLPYREGMTLLDVMIAVKGLTDFADGDNAKLVRMQNGKPKSYTVELESLIKGGDISKNRTVYPGDTIIIPETWF
jgi:polysaccharide export outer membrane protein